jgi:hypothetical protein
MHQGYIRLRESGPAEPAGTAERLYPGRAKGIDTAQYVGIIEQITVSGEVYALPFRSDFWLVFYNKDLFDAAGVPYPSNDLTLDEYDALARRVTRGTGANKTYGAHYHTWRSTVQLFGLLDGKKPSWTAATISSFPVTNGLLMSKMTALFRVMPPSRLRALIIPGSSSTIRSP